MMRTILPIFAVAAALLPGLACAQPSSPHHHARRAGAVRMVAPAAYGSTLDALAARAQHEPGLTSELAPDAKQTATGGPVGGIPGWSGGP